ncbi:MAG TPA: hypothetical protein PLG77_04380 [Burkholderiaceae bacterium]|nr:hypothetical protein [Burkholderiaceae bacterium]
MVEQLRACERMNEDAEPEGTVEHQPRHMIGEGFTREQHFEAAARVRPQGWST